ncbi:heterokaryon incompatibility protein-domain-containing protein [Nemania abortiva]|nr:heterokaryon incompatibility protein-domain-containing protein [Nemania abortiva]
MPYQYGTLCGPRNIRLLSVIEAKPGEPLVAELSEHSLDHDASYIALSYAWDTGCELRALRIHDTDLLIHSNLYRCLECLWEKGIRTATWTDAICINQADDAEKSIQVPLMSDIYRGAAKVYVWLDRATDEERMAVRQLSNIVLGLEAADPALTLGALSATEAHTTFKSIGIPAPSSDVWVHLARVLNRPWFNRLWVLQEVLLARHISVLCGAEETEWDQITRFERQVLRRGLHKILQGTEFSSLQIFHMLNTIANFTTCKTRMLASPSKTEVPTPVLLHVMRRKKVTLSVDRIYGILSLVPPHLKSRVVIDYEAAPTAVHADFVKLNLPTDSMLELLSQVYGPDPGRPAALPSWCPELDRPPPINRFGGNNGMDSGYHAGFALPFVPKQVVATDTHSSIITLSGFQVDAVVEIKNGFDTPFASQINSDDAAKLLKWEQEVRALAKRALKGKDGWRNEYARALLADRALTADNMYCACEDDCLQTHERYLAHLRDVADLRTSASRPKYPMVDALADRVFIATEGGRIGYARPAVQVGDTVCVFENSIVPFILRFEGTDKPGRLVGEAYVSNLMRGEVLELEKSGLVRREDIRMT